MKWATDLITPLQVVLARVAIGFIPVLVFASVKKQLSINHMRHAKHFFVMACLAAAVYYYGFAKATSLLPSGIVGAMSGAIPLFSLVASLLFLRNETIGWLKILSLFIGFLGVFLIARPFDVGFAGASVEGVLNILLGSISLGMSFVYARKYVVPLNISAAALATYQLGFATLILFFFTDLQGIGRITESAVATWSLVLGLGILGTGLAYIIYYYLVSELGAVTASSVTYLPPIVALLIGAILVGEPIELLDYVATGLIVSGAILINRKNRDFGPRMKNYPPGLDD